MEQKKFKRLKREIVYESPWINLIVDKIELPNGHIIERQHTADILDSSVGIIMNEKEEILFVRPWRYVLNDIGLELPAGMIERGENPQDCFEREVKEETNLDLSEITYLFDYYTSNGISNQKVYVYKARCHIHTQEMKIQDEEVASYSWYTIPEVKALIKENKIVCGLSLSALLYHLAFY